MPVIFSTPTSHRVFMFDKDAEFMLKAMQTSGIVPGALFEEAIPDALQALKNRVQLEGDTDESTDSDENDYVGINTKAFPLIELLESAVDKNEKIMWEKG